MAVRSLPLLALLIAAGARPADPAAPVSRKLQDVHWAARDVGRDLMVVRDTLARSTGAGRPVALSVLRSDLARLDKHLTRLDRRLGELRALPAPEGPLPAP